MTLWQGCRGQSPLQNTYRGSPGLQGQSSVSQQERKVHTEMHSSKKPIHPQAQQRTKRPCRSS